MTQTKVIHAYRHLLRTGLQAVCYSYPARNSLRDLLRGAFRDKDAQLDERAIKRTIWFLKNAARELGIEHRIVKNLLMVQYWKQNVAKLDRASWSHIVSGNTSKKTNAIGDTTYGHYEKTIEMLNKTMGLCLPLR